ARHARPRSRRGAVRRGRAAAERPHGGCIEPARRAACGVPRRDAARMTPTFGRVVWVILRKDLTVEVRSKEVVYTTVFFAVSCILVFAFAWVQEGRPPEG